MHAADALGISRLATVRAAAGLALRNSVATTIAVNIDHAEAGQ